MLEAREQILSMIKDKRKLIISPEDSLIIESVQYRDNELFYVGESRESNMEEFRYSLSPKQALAKICAYYKEKGKITAEPGYKLVYAYMLKH